MSLTISNESFNGSALGQLANYSLDVTSTQDLTGKTVYLQVLGYVDVGAPKPTFEGVPEGVYFNTGGGTYQPSTGLHPTQHIPTPLHSVTDPFNFTISGQILIDADDGGVFNGTTIIDGSTRFIKNHILARQSFSNQYTSAFNRPKALRIVVFTDDCGFIEYECIDIPASLRFCDKGLLDGAPEYAMSLTFERDGVEVTDLSSFEDNEIVITIDTGGLFTPLVDPELLFFNDDNLTNDLNFIQESSLQYYQGATDLLGHAPVLVSYTPFANIGGNIWEARYVISSTYFTQGRSYRFIPLVQDNTGFYNSTCHISSLRSTAFHPPTTGIMSGTLTDFNDEYNGDCLLATVGERVESCVTVDKGSYDAAIIAAGLGTDFDTNFSSVLVTVESPFIGIIEQFSSKANPQGYSSIDNSLQHTSCYEFRIPESTQDSIFTITHTFIYNVLDPNGLTYQDRISYPQLIQVRKLDDIAATPLITSVIYKDDQGNVIDELCDDYKEPITVEVTKIATVDDYNLIAVILEQGADIASEEESYDNLQLAQSSTGVLSNVSAQFVADVATFNIDPTDLLPDLKYVVYAVAKKVVAPAVPCPVLQIDTDMLVSTVVPQVAGNLVTVQIDYSLSDLGAALVTSVDIDTKIGASAGAPLQSDSFAAAAGTYNFVYLDLFPPTAIRLEIDIVLDNGCIYTDHVQIDYVVPNVGFTTSLTDSIDPD